MTHALKGTHGGDWSDERVERMRKLWNDGHSASQIAKALDCGISRNAVIGKLARLGLTRGTARSVSQAVGGRAPHRTRPQPKTAAPPLRRPHSQTTLPPVAALPKLKTAQAPSRWLCLTDVGPHMCRYIEGDPGAGNMDRALMCAADTVTGEVYCAAHAAIAFNALKPGRDAAKPTFDRRRYNGRNANGLSRSTVFWE